MHTICCLCIYLNNLVVGHFDLPLVKKILFRRTPELNLNLETRYTTIVLLILRSSIYFVLARSVLSGQGFWKGYADWWDWVERFHESAECVGHNAPQAVVPTVRSLVRGCLGQGQRKKAIASWHSSRSLSLAGCSENSRNRLWPRKRCPRARRADKHFCQRQLGVG